MMFQALDTCNIWQHMILFSANHAIEQELHNINISREMPTLKFCLFFLEKKRGP